MGWEDSIERILKRLGKKEMKIGNEKFDKHYLIQSKDADTTISLFSDEIIDCLLKYNVYSLSYLPEKMKKNSNLPALVTELLIKTNNGIHYTFT